MDYVTSDLHFGDENVLFKRFGNLNQNKYISLIIENFNAILNDDDFLYVLGDIGEAKHFSLLKSVFSKIKGRKILIKGNHDIMKDEAYKEIGFEKVYDFPLFYENNIIFSHYPLPLDNSYYINIHGHLHNEKLNLKNYFNASVDVNGYKPVKVVLFTRFANNLKRVEKKFGNEWYFKESEKGQIILKENLMRI